MQGVVTKTSLQNSAAQRGHYENAERMLLASFVTGLIGNPSVQVRYASPQNLDQVLKIALSVQEAENRRSLVKASMPVSITRLDSILLARRIALAMDRVAQRKRSTRQTRREVSIMQLLVTTRNQRPRELGMRRRRRPFDVTNVKGSAILEGSVRRAKRERPVQRTCLEGGIPLSVRDVHGPPANGPHQKRTGSAKRKPRIRETRERRK